MLFTIVIFLVPALTLASDSHHPVYLSRTWWEGLPKTWIETSALTVCAILSRKVDYKEAFSFDKERELCQILDEPASVQTRPWKYQDGADVTKVYLPSKRVRPGIVGQQRP